jgi:hypothetical protein
MNLTLLVMLLCTLKNSVYSFRQCGEPVQQASIDCEAVATRYVYLLYL